MTPLTDTQREVLISALIEDWKESIANDFKNFDDLIEDWLYHGRVGFKTYSSDELIDACEDAELYDALEEAGVELEDEED